MRIGIDIQHLRMERRGIYYYLWNILERMCRQPHAHQLALYLYGQAWMDEPEDVRCWEQAFPKAPLQYDWDGPALRLLAHGLGIEPVRAPWLVRRIDCRLLLPWWRKRANAGA